MFLGPADPPDDDPYGDHRHLVQCGQCQHWFWVRDDEPDRDDCDLYRPMCGVCVTPQEPRCDDENEECPL